MSKMIHKPAVESLRKSRPWFYCIGHFPNFMDHLKMVFYGSFSNLQWMIAYRNEILKRYQRVIWIFSE